MEESIHRGRRNTKGQEKNRELGLGLMCVCVCVYLHLCFCVCVCTCVYVNMYAGTHRSQKRALYLLELELQALHDSGLLGTKLARAESLCQPSPG